MSDAELNRLFDQMQLLTKQGQFAEAIKVGLKYCDLAKKTHGENSKWYSDGLNDLGFAYNSMGDYARAEPVYRKLIEIDRRTIGEEHPDFATSLDNMAGLYQAMGDYAKAEPLYRRSMDIRRLTLGEEHPNYAASQNNLALVYKKIGDYAKAEPLYRRSMEIDRKVLGENHPNYATDLNNMALLYQAMGDHSKAEPLFRQSMEIRRKVLGEGHPSYATSLHNLAGFYKDMADYAKAEPLFRQSMEIWRKVLGEEHPHYVTSLSLLASIYQAKGDYAKAEPLFRQSMEKRRKALGEEHPDYATSLNNMAGLYQAKGDYKEAEPLYRRSTEIYRKVLGEGHPDYARSLNNLAELYRNMGDYAKAEPLYRKSMEIWRRALGEGHPDYAASLNNLAILHQAMGDYAKAEPLYRQSLEIRLRALGDDHPDYAASLNNLALLYKKMGDHAKAEPLYRRSIEIQRKALGTGHPDYAACLNNLAELYDIMGDYAKAEPLYRQSLEIYRKAMGEGHPHYALSLNNLALLHKKMGDHAKAEPLYRQSMEIECKALGKNHPNYAACLSNLASLHHKEGDFAKAEPLYRQAIEIYRKALGEGHPDYATSLNNLASLYRDLGDFTKAEPLDRQSIEIRRRALGEDHPDYAMSLNNLAVHYLKMGDYAKAEPLYRRSTEIQRKALGDDHPDYAKSLNNLAVLYKAMGDYAKAESLNRQSMEIRLRALGDDHPDYAESLNNLAALYLTMGDYAKAEPLCRQSMEAARKALGEEHPNYATSLNNLAGFYEKTGDYAKAEPLFRQSMEICRKTLGNEHPDYARDSNNLAGLYSAMGDHARAEPLYRQSIEINRKVLGEEHLHYAASLHNLGVLLGSMGRFPEALDLLRKELAVVDKNIENVFSVTSEKQKFAFLETIGFRTNYYLSLIRLAFLQEPQCCSDALDVVLRRKGIILESMSRQTDSAQYSDDPQVNELKNELNSVCSAIVKLSYGTGSDDPQRTAGQLKELGERKERLQIELSRKSASFAQEMKARRADTKSVSSVLPNGSALVEIIDSQEYLFKEGRWGDRHYLAFVLNSGADSPALIDLGTADEIEPLIDRYRAEMELENNKYSQGTPNKVEEQMTGVSRGIAVAGTQPEGDITATGFQAICRALYDKVFAPLKPYLQGVEHLFISPDGALNLISFGSLLDPEDKFVVEGYHLTYLASGRDLLRHSAGKPQAPVAFADPDYDADTEVLKKSEQHLTSEFASRAANEGQKGWGRLGTASRKEASIILGLFLSEGASQPRVYLGADASAEALTGVNAPRILHLSTHGFFWRDIERPKEERLKSDLTGVGKVMEHIGKLENPMHQSGLVLSGANRMFKDESDTTGWVTAEEVSGLNLRGTELVVLSACSTGMGEVKKGEGVLGLRRAFRMAGAQSLVMSLWKVPNEETKDLMVDFYTNFKADGQAPVALRDSMLEIINSARKKGGLAHPFYWAAFICEGGSEVQAAPQLHRQVALEKPVKPVPIQEQPEATPPPPPSQDDAFLNHFPDSIAVTKPIQPAQPPYMTPPPYEPPPKYAPPMPVETIRSKLQDARSSLKARQLKDALDRIDEVLSDPIDRSLHKEALSIRKEIDRTNQIVKDTFVAAFVDAFTWISFTFGVAALLLLWLKVHFSFFFSFALACSISICIDHGLYCVSRRTILLHDGNYSYFGAAVAGAAYFAVAIILKLAGLSSFWAFLIALGAAVVAGSLLSLMTSHFRPVMEPIEIGLLPGGEIEIPALKPQHANVQSSVRPARASAAPIEGIAIFFRVVLFVILGAVCTGLVCAAGPALLSLIFPMFQISFEDLSINPFFQVLTLVISWGLIAQLSSVVFWFLDGPNGEYENHFREVPFLGGVIAATIAVGIDYVILSVSRHNWHIPALGDQLNAAGYIPLAMAVATCVCLTVHLITILMTGERKFTWSRLPGIAIIGAGAYMVALLLIPAMDSMLKFDVGHTYELYSRIGWIAGWSIGAAIGLRIGFEGTTDERVLSGRRVLGLLVIAIISYLIIRQFTNIPWRFWEY